MREEDRASVHSPFGEKANSNASPPGNEAEQLVVDEVRLTMVWRGLRYASNKFRLTSRTNCFFNWGRLSSVKGPVTRLFVMEKAGHRERW